MNNNGVLKITSLLSLLFACAPPPSVESASPTTLPSCADKPSRDTTVYDTTQVSRKPEVVSGPNLSYPDELRQQGISGRVVYSVIVNPNGIAEYHSISVLRSDHIEFERVSRRYVEQARFSPGCLNGEAVRVRMALPIDFRVRR